MTCGLNNYYQIVNLMTIYIAYKQLFANNLLAYINFILTYGR